MNYELACILLAIFSLFTSGFALFSYLFSQKKIQRLTRLPNMTAEEILHDLTRSGTSLIKIERVSPEDIFLRSPRGL